METQQPNNPETQEPKTGEPRQETIITEQPKEKTSEHPKEETTEESKEIAQPREILADQGFAVLGLGIIPISNGSSNNMFYIVNRNSPTETLTALTNTDMQKMSAHNHSHEHEDNDNDNNDHYEEHDENDDEEQESYNSSSLHSETSDEADEYVTSNLPPVVPHAIFGNPLLRQPTFSHSPAGLHIHQNNQQDLSNLHAVITGLNLPIEDPNNPRVTLNSHPLSFLGQTNSRIETSERRSMPDSLNADRRPHNDIPTLSITNSLNELGRLFSSNSQQNIPQQNTSQQNNLEQNRDQQDGLEGAFSRITREIAPQINEMINQIGGVENLTEAIINSVRTITDRPRVIENNNRQENNVEEQFRTPQRDAINPRTPTAPIRQNIRQNRHLGRLIPIGSQDDGPIGIIDNTNVDEAFRTIPNFRETLRNAPVREDRNVRRRLIPPTEERDDNFDQINQNEQRERQNRVRNRIFEENQQRAREENRARENRPRMDRLGFRQAYNESKLYNVNGLLKIITIIQAIDLVFIGSIAVTNPNHFYLVVMLLSLFVASFVVANYLRPKLDYLHTLMEPNKHSPLLGDVPLDINGQEDRVARARRRDDDSDQSGDSPRGSSN
jgi:hypothetical protein